MFDTARDLYERIKHQWQVNAPSQDEFTLYIYETIENEYDSGDVHKGLMAKSNVECDYEPSKAKALYIRTRVNQLLKYREEITQIIADINTQSDHVANLKAKVESEQGRLLNINQTPDESDLRVARDKIKADAERLKTKGVEDNNELPDPAILSFFGLVLLCLAIVNHLDNDRTFTFGTALLIIGGSACFGAIPVFNRHKQNKMAKVIRTSEELNRQVKPANLRSSMHELKKSSINNASSLSRILKYCFCSLKRMKRSLNANNKSLRRYFHKRAATVYT